MKTSRLIGTSLATLCSVLVVFGNAAAYAATTAKKAPAPTVSQTLKVSPLRTSVTIQQGASAKVQTYVTNVTKNTIIVKPIENDFVAGDEQGNPAIILDPNSYAPTHSLKRYMLPLPDVTLAAGETKEVDVTISVPKTAQAGGYFGSVRFAPDTGSGSSSVSLGASVASLILLTVPGPAVERLTLTNFDVQQNGGTSSNFRTPNDLSLLLRFNNQGNLQEAPFGQIYVQKGKKIVYRYNFNQDDPKSEILPDSARRWTVPLKGLGKFGKYTVGATISYGSKGQSIQITKTVWIVPTVVIMIVVVAIVVIALLVVGLWLFLRNYKRRILKSSRRRY